MRRSGPVRLSVVDVFATRVVEEPTRGGDSSLPDGRGVLARAAGERDAGLRAEAAHLRNTISSIRQRRDALLDALAGKTITDARYREYEPNLLGEQVTAEERLAQVEWELQNRERREAWAKTLKETVLQFPQVWKQLELYQQ
jgi:hypothetical protein